MSHTYIYVYIYMCVCVCLRACVCNTAVIVAIWNRERCFDAFYLMEFKLILHFILH